MGAYSKLHNYTARKLQKAGFSFSENVRPGWLISHNLTRLELDIFIESEKVAIEIQGEQHFRFISFFHKSYSEFEKRKQYDQEKRDLCHGAGIRLVEICTEKDADIFVSVIALSKRSTEPDHTLSKLQRDAIKAIERNNKGMADGLCKKCLRQLHLGREKELHSMIIDYLSLCQ